MDATIVGISFFLVTLILNWGKQYKPLYVDDGNWFYQTVFSKIGKKLYYYDKHVEHKDFDLLRPHGYFTIDWLASKFHWKSANNEKFIQWFKIILYSLTSALLSITGLLLFNSLIAGITAGMIFALATGSGKTTYSDITYAEWFIIFPLTLSVLLLYIGNDELWSFAAAGIILGWALHIKITSFGFAVFIPGFYISDNWIIELSIFLAAFITMMFLPVLLISISTSSHKKQLIKYYLKNFFNPVIIGFLLVMQKTGLVKIKKGNAADKLITVYGTYTKGKWDISNSVFKEFVSLKNMIKPIWQKFDIFLIITLAGSLSLLGDFNKHVLLLTILLAVNFILIMIQKNYFRPKINTMWMPVSILTGYSLSKLNFNTIEGFLIVLILLYALLKTILPVLSGLKKTEREKLNDYSDEVQNLFKLSKQIGLYIKKISRPEDNLLVWGNYSNIYIYAERNAHMALYPFMFPNNKIISEELLEKAFHLKTAPKYIQIFDYNIKDRWNPDRIQILMKASYKVIKTFKFSDEKKKVRNFHLMERQDKSYKQILHSFLSKCENSEEKDIMTRKIKTVDINDYELKYYYETLNMNIDQKIEYIHAQLSNNNNTAIKQSIMGRLLLEKGNIDAATQLLNSASGEYTDFRDLISLGEIAFMQGSLSIAADCFKKAIDFNPICAEAYNNLGVYFNQIRDIPNSQTCFQTALLINPDYKEARENLNSLINNGNHNRR